MDASDDLTGEEKSRYLEAAMKMLPEEDYTLIVLYYYEDQSIEEISRLRVSPKAMRK